MRTQAEAAAHAAQGYERDSGDGGDQRPEGPAGGVAVPRHPGPEERLLGDLLGIGAAAELAAAVFDERRVARLVQLGEDLVARLLVCAFPAIELYGHGATFRRPCGHAGSPEQNTTTAR